MSPHSPVGTSLRKEIRQPPAVTHRVNGDKQPKIHSKKTKLRPTISIKALGFERDYSFVEN
jgi:hypothetical protein